MVVIPTGIPKVFGTKWRNLVPNKINFSKSFDVLNFVLNNLYVLDGDGECHSSETGFLRSQLSDEMTKTQRIL